MTDARIFTLDDNPADRAPVERELLESIVNSSPDAIVIVDESRRIILFNPAAEQVFRCSAAAALGGSLDRFIPPGLSQTGPDPAAALGIGGPQSQPRRLVVSTGRRADGNEFPFEASVSQMGIAGRSLFAVNLRDITRRRELESQLLQAQKVETFGLLAGGIAHDFNNIISLVIGYSELLMREECCLPAGRNYVQQINDAGRRAAALTRQLLTFSRKETMRFRGESLNEIVANLTHMLRRIIGEHIALALELDPGSPAVRVDAAMVEQVMMNLAVNARDAMRRGGELRIATLAMTVGPEQAVLHGREPGPYVALKVSDTGTGMTPEVTARIFEPFFTTKSRGKGTGLGLSTVQHIMREHSGWIEVASEPGMGATFTAYFPRVLAASSTHSGAPNHAAVAEKTRSGSIFVVEDEAPVRDLLVRVLTGRGHKVVSAESADAALRVWDENCDNLDLLLTDIVLPGGMSGRELAVQFQRQKPGLKVLYMSGYINDANDREFMRKGQHQLLQKPFPLDQLLRLVRELLDEAHDSRQQQDLPA